MFVKWFLACYFMFMFLILGQSWQTDPAWVFKIEDSVIDKK